ncbi:unnamed protein product [Somion occarium]|uniref:Hcy-binding domain-containing protein n=1 Tax=Somion occarium TaxID=3059160 RepID=A0ABP1DFW4_9APHY
MTVFDQEKKVLVLDGGFGTTLEDVFHKDISTPLWSAKPIDEDPGLIINTHLAFLRAGADIILTSTYQCAFSTFEKAGYSREDAVRLMRKSVQLAVAAKALYLADRKDVLPHQVKIALSLGPFGATLSPAQEFGGYYPPPYGPGGSKDKGTNALNDDVEEERAIEALKEFHLERLRVFKEDEEAWNAIDFIAFETVPLTREIRAIRRAVATLQSEDPMWSKPYWISAVFPEGRFPEKDDTGQHVEIAKVVKALLEHDKDQIAAYPDGIGINCTSVEFLFPLVQGISKEIIQPTREQVERRPWLVLYPNGGDVYEPTTKSWIPQRNEKSWSDSFGGVVHEVVDAEIWPGIIVGGCCKTRPHDIYELSKIVKHSICKP